MFFSVDLMTLWGALLYEEVQLLYIRTLSMEQW